jgi:hypothetical protein
MLLRGNVLLQSASPNNNSQVIAVYNDGGVAGLSFTIRLVSNTFVGNGGHAALVHLSNDDGTVMSAELVNNIVAGTSVVTLVEDGANATVSGSNNWIVTGASAAGLGASVSGAEPGFANAAGKNFTLAPGSGAIGKAASTSDLPDHEYYRDEQVARQSRARSSVRDLGAFESTTTSDPVGPYGNPIDAGADAPVAIDARPPGTGGTTATGGSAGTGGATGAGGASTTGAGAGGDTTTQAGGGKSSGCGCATGGRARPASWSLIALVVVGRLFRRGLRRRPAAEKRRSPIALA